MKDLQGREYAKASKVKAGTILETDGGFICIAKGTKVKVLKDRGGGLYFECGIGHHYLDVQLKGNYYIGLYHA